MKMTVFRDAGPCSLVKIYRRFRGAYCLHHQDDDCLYILLSNNVSNSMEQRLS
jgi:hypothetical protein